MLVGHEQAEMAEFKDWISVIGTLAGAVVGGVIGLLVAGRQLRHQHALEREKRQLANFERIHKCLSTLSDQAGILSAQVIANVGAGLPFNLEALGDKVSPDELSMLVDFYAPKLRPDIQQIEEHLLAVGRAAGEAIAASQRTDQWKTATILAATTASAEIRKLSGAAKEKLRELAAPYTRPG
jgi:gas vesicle protein